MPWVLEEEESLPILKAAYDRGLNTWDTANVYSNGVSEEIIGKARLGPVHVDHRALDASHLISTC